MNRAVHDAEIARLDALLLATQKLVDRYSSIAQDAVQRYDDAVRMYADIANRALQMRKEGFAPIEPPAPPPQEPMPQAVEAAIEERAVSPELDRHLRRWARQELTSTAPDVVAKRILEGVAEQEDEL